MKGHIMPIYRSPRPALPEPPAPTPKSPPPVRYGGSLRLFRLDPPALAPGVDSSMTDDRRYLVDDLPDMDIFPDIEAPASPQPTPLMPEPTPPVCPPTQSASEETSAANSAEGDRMALAALAQRPRGGRRTSRRIDDQYTLCPQSPDFILPFTARPSAIALVIQYREMPPGGPSQRTHGLVPPKPVLSISAAANFGLRDPDKPATSVVLVPTFTAPVTPKLMDVIGFVLREAACSSQRFREEPLDIFLHAPDPSGLRLGACFGLMPNTEFPCPSILNVPDLAGHRHKMRAHLHDLTSRLGAQGLGSFQRWTDSCYGPSSVGDVEQDLTALWQSDPGEYVRVAAHQACLALHYGLDVCFQKH